MTHQAKIDWWIAAAIVFAVIVLLVGVDYWIAGPVLLVLLICAYPQSYQTTADGLLIRGGLWRRLIPYEVITFVGPISDDRGNLVLSTDPVRIQYGIASELRIAPADPRAFLADIARHTPHLIKRGYKLVPAFA
ncbi:MAG: PH domain-containing protein [Bryobacteraceae bacterium]|jgi:hypothetical protein